ncbi:MAG TPA: N4-gp56 family major capsid protein [Gaiellales bacterium]|nr:N4-gp56 family major capsid protein [Gaiellales bacterium]
MPGSAYNYNDPGLSTTTGSLAGDLAPLWLKDEVLAIAEKTTVFADLADDVSMPEAEGKTFSAQRYERLALPMAPLTEGVTPDSTPLNVTSVSGVLEQWGLVVSLTDVAQMTTKHPAMTMARERLGTAGAELIDREVQRVLAGGGTLTIAGGKASVSLLTAGDVVNTDLLSKAIADLRQLGAPSYQGGLYAGVVDPYVEQDIAKDPTFVSSHTYAETEALMNAEIGRWRGVKWKRSNMIPIVTQLTTANVTQAAADAGAAQAGETNFAAGSTVNVQATLQDSASGFTSAVSTSRPVTNAGTFSVAVTIASGAPTGVYGIYVSGEGTTALPSYQLAVNHVTGTADTRTFVKAGIPNGANRFVASATGSLAPAAPPAAGTVHYSYIFGKSAFAVPKLGPKLEATITPATATDSDPLKQRRKAGVKAFFKAVIQNRDFYRVIASMSAFN